LQSDATPDPRGTFRVFGLVYVSLRANVVKPFTDDPAVLRLAADAILVVALFQVSNSVPAVCCDCAVAVLWLCCGCGCAVTVPVPVTVHVHFPVAAPCPGQRLGAGCVL